MCFLTCNWKQIIKYDLYIKFSQIFAHNVQMCATFSCENFTDVCQVFWILLYYTKGGRGVFLWTCCSCAHLLPLCESHYIHILLTVPSAAKLTAHQQDAGQTVTTAPAADSTSTSQPCNSKIQSMLFCTWVTSINFTHFIIIPIISAAQYWQQQNRNQHCQKQNHGKYFKIFSSTELYLVWHKQCWKKYAQMNTRMSWKMLFSTRKCTFKKWKINSATQSKYKSSSANHKLCWSKSSFEYPKMVKQHWSAEHIFWITKDAASRQVFLHLQICRKLTM